MHLLAEDLLLLLLRDDTGRPAVDSTKLDLALAGAVVLELAQRERVGLSEPGEDVKPGRLVLRDQAPTGEAVLDQALTRLAAKGPKKPEDVLTAVAKGLRQELLAGLVSRGILRAEERRVFWVIPDRSWPAADLAHERAVLRSLRDVLVVGRPPLPREAALISLLAAVDAVAQVLPDTGLGKRELQRRAQAVAEGDFAGEAVRTAVVAMQSAVAAAVMVSTTAAATASTS